MADAPSSINIEVPGIVAHAAELHCEKTGQSIDELVTGLLNNHLNKQALKSAKKLAKGARHVR